MKDNALKKREKAVEYSIEDLMDKYLGFVYSIVCKKLNMTASAQDIEETVSDVFVRLYKSMDSFDPQKSSVKTFIGTVARNTATDKYRQLTGKKSELTADSETLIDNLTDGEADVCVDVIKKEERETVFQALLSLKEPDRTIVFRRFYLDESFEAIATITGCSPNAVQKRLKRALKKLEERLKGKV